MKKIIIGLLTFASLSFADTCPKLEGVYYCDANDGSFIDDYGFYLLGSVQASDEHIISIKDNLDSNNNVQSYTLMSDHEPVSNNFRKEIMPDGVTKFPYKSQNIYTTSSCKDNALIHDVIEDGWPAIPATTEEEINALAGKYTIEQKKGGYTATFILNKSPKGWLRIQHLRPTSASYYSGDLSLRETFESYCRKVSL